MRRKPSAGKPLPGMVGMPLLRLERLTFRFVEAGFVVLTGALVLGVAIGMVAGFFGGFIDGLISRITDAFLACPFLILAIALAAFLGPSLSNAMIAIGVSAAPIFVRLTRAQVINIKVEDYIEAARAVGCSPHG